MLAVCLLSKSSKTWRLSRNWCLRAQPLHGMCAYFWQDSVCGRLTQGRFKECDFVSESSLLGQMAWSPRLMLSKARCFINSLILSCVIHSKFTYPSVHQLWPWSSTVSETAVAKMFQQSSAISLNFCICLVLETAATCMQTTKIPPLLSLAPPRSRSPLLLLAESCVFTAVMKKWKKREIFNNLHSVWRLENKMISTQILLLELPDLLAKENTECLMKLSTK